MHRNPSKSNRNSSRRPPAARGRVRQSTPPPTTRQRYDLRRVDNVACEAVSAAHAPDSTIKETVPGFYGAHAQDHAFKANLARLTNGISPAGMLSLYVDWLAHLALSPGKQLQLVEKAARKSARLTLYLGQTAAGAEMPPCIEPVPQDRRFRSDAWQQWPLNLIYQSFLMTQQLWHNASTEIDGLSDERERVLSFIARQMLDRYAPSNALWTDPEVLARTVEEGG